jgi:hypothetical protein
MSCSLPPKCCLSAAQERFLAELFELCNRYQNGGVLAVSMGHDRCIYIVKVEMIKLAQSETQD